MKRSILALFPINLFSMEIGNLTSEDILLNQFETTVNRTDTFLNDLQTRYNEANNVTVDLNPFSSSSTKRTFADSAPWVLAGSALGLCVYKGLKRYIVQDEAFEQVIPLLQTTKESIETILTLLPTIQKRLTEMEEKNNEIRKKNEEILGKFHSYLERLKQQRERLNQLLPSEAREPESVSEPEPEQQPAEQAKKPKKAHWWSKK